MKVGHGDFLSGGVAVGRRCVEHEALTQGMSFLRLVLLLCILLLDVIKLLVLDFVLVLGITKLSDILESLPLLLSPPEDSIRSHLLQVRHHVPNKVATTAQPMPRARTSSSRKGTGKPNLSGQESS